METNIILVKWTNRKHCFHAFGYNKLIKCFWESYKRADLSTGCLVGMSTPPLSFLFLAALAPLKLWLSPLSAESLSAVSLDVVRSMVSPHFRVLTEFCAFLSWEMLWPLTCSCQLPESLVCLGLCLTVSELLLLAPSRLLALTEASRDPLCSGEFDSLRTVEQDAGLVPGGSDRDERMQSSIGNNLGSAVASKAG